MEHTEVEHTVAASSCSCVSPIEEQTTVDVKQTVVVVKQIVDVAVVSLLVLSLLLS